jgi:hypothetical protein
MLFNRFSTFRFLLLFSLLLMLVGHVVLHGQPFGFEGRAFDPRSNYVSEYAGHWPQGLWIKASIIVFCVALVWFCNQMIMSMSTGPWLLIGKFFWLMATILMIVGLVLVMLFDVVPQSPVFFMEWLMSKVGLGRSKPPNGMPEHEVGFQLFIIAYLLPVLVLISREIKLKAWDELATSLVIITLIFCSYWWLAAGTFFPGVPQRALLGLAAFQLYRGGIMIHKQNTKYKN